MIYNYKSTVRNIDITFVTVGVSINTLPFPEAIPASY